MKSFTSFPDYSEIYTFFGQGKQFCPTTSNKHFITSLNKRQTEHSAQVMLQDIKFLSRKRALDHPICTTQKMPWRDDRRQSPGDKKLMGWLYTTHFSHDTMDSTKVHITLREFLTAISSYSHSCSP